MIGAMGLDPRVRLLVRLGNLRPDDPTVPMAVRRSQSASLSAFGAWLVMPKGPEPAAVREVSVPVDGGAIRVRILVPHGPGPHPLYVFLHGGGWCQGTLGEREARCRAISAGATCAVASVDYRMAPENQYPTAPEDCYAALCWLVEHADELGIDATRVAVGGESAGGNLAAVLCLMSRDRGGPAICHQWLDVPATDCTLSQSGHREVPDGYLLDAAVIDDYLALYIPDPGRVREPYCSPLLADDLSGLPPAWIMTAEYDRLRGDGEAYADALQAAGVPARHVRLAGHVHPSFAFTRIPSSAAYERDAIAALAAAFTA
ncbi:MAG: alpha/beta hydrolase [Acidimicrobiales bacterium]